MFGLLGHSDGPFSSHNCAISLLGVDCAPEPLIAAFFVGKYPAFYGQVSRPRSLHDVRSVAGLSAANAAL